MTAASAESAAFEKAGPDFCSVTSPQPMMPQRMVFMGGDWNGRRGRLQSAHARSARAVPAEEPGHAVVAEAFGAVERGTGGEVGGVDVGAVLEQQRGDVVAALLHRDHQRGHAVA